MNYASLTWVSVICNENVLNNIVQAGNNNKVSENLNNIINNGLIVHNLWKWVGLYIFKNKEFLVEKQPHFIPQNITSKEHNL